MMANKEITTILGTSMGGGFYAGRIMIDGNPFAIIVAPKSEGEHNPVIWIPKYKAVPEARSYNDGHVNTRAMAEAGSKLAQWALDLRIGGFDDWYLPAQDELEVIYRNLKPTARENYCYVRSGINLSAIEPTRPYTPDCPLQTESELFKAGGAEAFDEAWYWTSTQHVSGSDYAWGQYFNDGTQDYVTTLGKGRARSVRRLPL